MTDKIKELEAKLALAKKEEAKEAGFNVVVFEGDELIEIKAKAHELTNQEKANIMAAAGTLGDNLEEIKSIAEALDDTIGPWLKLTALIDYPLKNIIAVIFDLDASVVASLPNIELLGMLFEEHQWINNNAKNLAKELDFIAKKQ